jgi:hypothetical protein
MNTAPEGIERYSDEYREFLAKDPEVQKLAEIIAPNVMHPWTIADGPKLTRLNAQHMHRLTAKRLLDAGYRKLVCEHGETDGHPVYIMAEYGIAGRRWCFGPDENNAIKA